MSVPMPAQTPALPDVVGLTQALVRYDTVNAQSPERACALHLAGLLEGGGLHVQAFEHAPGRTNLVATLTGRADRAPLCFTGHLDTVPLGAQPWSKAPFGGEIEDGRLYGRGSADMKGGIAAMVCAALELAPHAGRGPGLTLVLTASEESGCQGAQHLASCGDALGQAGAIVVGEPTGNYPLLGHRGALWLRARTTGVAAHGAMPHLGVNAVYKAANAVQKLAAFRFKVHRSEALGLPTLNVGTLHGGVNVNMVPDEAILEIDIRTLPEQGHQRVLHELRHCLGDDVELEPLLDLPGIYTDAAQPWVVSVFDLLASHLGERPQPRSAPYFTDASVLTPAFGGVPTVILGPGEAGMAHQTDEWCAIDSLCAARDIYVDLARRWGVA